METEIRKIVGVIEIPQDKISFFQKEIKNISDFKKKINSVLAENATEILEVILGGTIILNSSDIHIEPEEKKAKIRSRIDGILQDIIFFDLKIHQLLISRIKLLSGLKLNITDRPQDGRFSIILPSLNKEVVSIEVRTSALPSEYGETIVLRILNPKSLINLEDLGLREDLLKLFEKEIKKPNGMIIVTGPTGSGKTTTLYAFLNKIQTPEIKIITIEDPIEYHLKGISQTQVEPEKGYDFANGLKSIMRQDPDVILVGEVRDLETANIGLQAALTGHLVFTTLHTNDAAGTIARLINLGAKLADIGPAINLAVAQRLLRRVCKKCSKMEKISIPVLNKIKKGLAKIPKEIKMPKLDEKLMVSKAIGCSNCNLTGYKGRLGIFEVFLVDDEIEKFILTSPAIASLKEKAIEKGMITMYQDGLIKVIEGKTTLEEVERATGE